jgi:hypothetical protein
MSEVVVGLACEDRGHFCAVTRIVDDALLSTHAWLDGVIANCRSWGGLNPGEEWYKYNPDDAHDVRPVTIDGVRIAPQGHIGGEPLKPEAGMWRKVLLLFCHRDPQPEVVILVRDMDGYPERRGGLIQVRDGLRWPFRVVVAAAQPEVEAWRAAGFIASDDGERASLDAVRRELSFDPTTQSHRLTSHPNDAPTDAKRVLDCLCKGDEDRLDECLRNHDLLKDHGEHNGLATFLCEVDEKIVPLLGRPQ